MVREYDGILPNILHSGLDEDQTMSLATRLAWVKLNTKSNFKWLDCNDDEGPNWEELSQSYEQWGQESQGQTNTSLGCSSGFSDWCQSLQCLGQRVPAWSFKPVRCKTTHQSPRPAPLSRTHRNLGHTQPQRRHAVPAPTPWIRRICTASPVHGRKARQVQFPLEEPRVRRTSRAEGAWTLNQVLGQKSGRCIRNQQQHRRRRLNSRLCSLWHGKFRRRYANFVKPWDPSPREGSSLVSLSHQEADQTPPLHGDNFCELANVNIWLGLLLNIQFWDDQTRTFVTLVDQLLPDPCNVSQMLVSRFQCCALHAIRHDIAHFHLTKLDPNGLKGCTSTNPPPVHVT